MRYFKRVFFVLIAAIFMSCVSSVSDVATVNNEKISKQAFDAKKAFYLAYSDIDPATEKMPQMEQTFLNIEKMTLEKLINNKLIEQAAAKLKLTVSEADIQAKYDHTTADLATGTKSKKPLYTKEALLQESKEQALAEKVIVAVEGEKLVPTESEVKTFFQQNNSAFNAPETFVLHHILIKAQAKDPQKAEKKKKAEKLYEQVKANPDKFESLASQYSEDPLIRKYGISSLGPLSKEQLSPELYAAALNTQPGKIHDGPVESSSGYHIVLLEKRIPPVHKSYEQAKAEASLYLSDLKKAAALEKYLTEEKKKAKININPNYQKLVSTK